MQNALIASKIARFDYPSHWPELFSTLIQSLETANMDQTIHYRVLEILNEILYTRVSGIDEVASRIFQALVQVYLVYTDRTIMTISHLGENLDQNTLLIDLDIISICIKCLRVLMMNNIKDFHKYDETRVSNKPNTIAILK